MAYDEQLAERIRRLLAERHDVDEKKMFGGLAFLVNGNMAVAARGRGGLLVRVDPDESDALIESEPGTSLMEMRGRSMTGWLSVAAEEVDDDADLERWVRRGEEFAASLQPK
jgi:TfoX/Sxy family transcriptional regulator of competence genes